MSVRFIGEGRRSTTSANGGRIRFEHIILRAGFELKELRVGRLPSNPLPYNQLLRNLVIFFLDNKPIMIILKFINYWNLTF